ncbi:protein kinase domain-containing protein [Roseiconus lacunae]|uniref:protein kinase domain-containing protein n=1 Tax=Roseiconus lacunae TaxID=2605694 RepID=UPI0011F1C458|nr:protein kinase [Roseiconus lacunae]
MHDEEHVLKSDPSMDSNQPEAKTVDQSCIDSAASELDFQVHQEVPSHVGNYSILALIASGGMGRVYRARRSSDGQEVALKVIARDLPSSRMLARFECERIALEMMEHPNIAKVLDSGFDDVSRPFVVMELVHGTPIDVYCDKHRLTITERLELFIQVCHAIHHAHQKGVIHRDIKPSNLLVQSQPDGQALVKVIDFGLSKSSHNEQIIDSFDQTQNGDLIGTIEYMSPEQARVTDAEVDSRTDVYSLGVILHQLLTGQSPIGRLRSLTDNLESLLRTLREEDVRRPSQHVRTAGDEIFGFAHCRGLTPEQLASTLDGSLDCVVLKALEKYPAYRYSTAIALADDIRHFVKGEPIIANPRPLVYQLQRSLVRHRYLATMAAVVVVVLGIGLATSILMWSQSETQRRRATIAERYAREAAEHATTVSEEAQLQRDAAIAARQVAEAMAAQTHYLLARDRGQQGRTRESLRLLQQVPPTERQIEWYLARNRLDSSLQTFAGTAKTATAIAFGPGEEELIATTEVGQVNRYPLDRTSSQVLSEFQLRAIGPLCMDRTGRWLASASKDDGVIVVDTTDNRVVAELPSFDTGVVALDWFSPPLSDSTQGRLAIATDRGTVLVINVESQGSEIQFQHSSHQIQAIKVSPIANAISVRSRVPWGGVNDGWIYMYDLDGALLWQSPSNESPVRCFSYTNDGGQILAGDSEGRLKMLDALTGERQRAYARSSQAASSIEFSPDGRLFAIGRTDGAIQLWRTEMYQSVALLCGHTRRIVDLCFHREGKRLVSSSVDKSVKLWDVEDSLVLHDETPTEIGSLAGIVGAVGVDPKGRFLAIAEGDSLQSDFDDVHRNYDIRILDSVTHRLQRRLLGHDDGVLAIAVRHDGQQLASASVDQTARLWDVSKQQAAPIVLEHNSGVSSIAYSRDGRTVATGSYSGIVRFWDATNGQLKRSFRSNDNVQSLTFSSDGNRLATGGSDGIIRIWDVKSGTQQFEIDAKTKHLHDLKFVDNDAAILSETADSSIAMWSLRTHQVLRLFEGHDRLVRSILLHPLDRRIISCSDDGTIRIWDLDSNRELESIRLHEAKAWTIAISAAGDRLYAGLRNGALVRWNAERRPPASDLALSRDQIRSASQNEQAGWIVTAGRDGTLAIWDRINGQQVSVTSPDHRVISAIAISPDRSRLVTGTASGQVDVYQVRTDADEHYLIQPLASVRQSSSAITALAFDQQQSVVVGRTSDGRVFEVAIGDRAAHSSEVGDRDQILRQAYADEAAVFAYLHATEVRRGEPVTTLLTTGIRQRVKFSRAR